MFRINILLISLFILIFSCQERSGHRDPLARVFHDYLYVDEMPSIPQSVDSSLFLQSFTNQWAIKKLLIHKSEFNFKNNPNYIDSLLNVYRESLLIHYYKEALIKIHLDTLIQDSIITSYYENNIDNFKLKEDIIKLNYIKIRQIAPNIEFLVQNYQSVDPIMLDSLEEYCLQFAEKFSFNNNAWVSWLDFSKELPIQGDYLFKNKKKFVKHKSTIELQDSIYRYFLNVQDFKQKGASSPIEYVSSLIRSILIHKRKKELISTIEYELINEALENNNFEIYE
tara:strand:+ start:626 stop:1471 length:846 start_codon:yes stop_codon:yes gene_type:complete